MHFQMWLILLVAPENPTITKDVFVEVIGLMGPERYHCRGDSWLSRLYPKSQTSEGFIFYKYKYRGPMLIEGILSMKTNTYIFFMHLKQ